MRRTWLGIMGLGIAAIVIVWAVWQPKSAHGPTLHSPTATKSSAPTPKTESRVNAFDKTTQSLSDPTSTWVIVNKHRPLQPSTYMPDDLVVPDVPVRVPGNESMRLRTEPATALKTLFAAAAADGAAMKLSSGFRSYAYQTSLYGKYVAESGRAAADTFSARPGYSEHQTGLAVDIMPLNGGCEVSECFADLPAGKWLIAHAHEYGFVLRYPIGKTEVTGYKYEPWHVRYVGKDLATQVFAAHTTLEEFFALEAATTYL